MEEVHLPRPQGVDAALDGRPLDVDVLLGEVQLHPGGDADLPLDDVHPGDQLRHRVLHLQTGVHLHKVEVPVFVHQKFHGARVDVPRGPGGPGGGLHQLLPGLGRDAGGGGLLDELLVVLLDGALPLPQTHDVPGLVGQQLHLDVLDRVQVLFQVHPAVPKGLQGLAGGGLEGPLHVLGLLHQADALAAAAGAGLEQHRVADLLRRLQSLLAVPEDIRARGGGHAVFLHQPPGGVLISHFGDDLRPRADELDAHALALVGEVPVFRQKAVARVDGLGAGVHGGGEDSGAV